MNKIRWSVIAIGMFFLLVNSGCGGGGGSSVPEYNIEANTSSREFQDWLNQLPPTPEEFVQYWQEAEVKNGWKTDDWTLLPWDLHKNDSSYEIWDSKLINCHRMTVLLLEKYNGEYLYLYQGENVYAHAVFKGADEGGVYYISLGGLSLKFCRTIDEIYGEYRIEDFKENKDLVF